MTTALIDPAAGIPRQVVQDAVERGFRNLAPEPRGECRAMEFSSDCKGSRG